MAIVVYNAYGNSECTTGKIIIAAKRDNYISHFIRRAYIANNFSRPDRGRTTRDPRAHHNADGYTRKENHNRGNGDMENVEFDEEEEEESDLAVDVDTSTGGLAFAQAIAIDHLRLTQTNRVRVATSEGAPIGSLAKGMSLSRALGVKATVQRFCM